MNRVTFRDRLRSFAIQYTAMLDNFHAELDRMTDKELKSLKDSTGNVSRHNCWCAIYEAAPIVRREIGRVQHQRTVARRVAKAKTAELLGDSPKEEKA